MEFPDGRLKEGMFENNIFKGPLSTPNAPELKQLGAKQLLMQDMLNQVTPTAGGFQNAHQA
jgi:hypothetical protein